MSELRVGVDAHRVVELRRRILRPHQPPAASHYADDRAPGALHLLIEDDGRAIGCASVYVEPLDDHHGLRFRGMAVEPARRGEGHGRRLVVALQEHARTQRTGLWCNARISAGAFYEYAGLHGHGAVFDLTPLGPHRVYRWHPDAGRDEGPA